MYQTTYSIRRHEEKNKNGLTNQGKINSFGIGLKFEDISKIYHSEISRSKETAEYIAKGSGIESICESSRLNEKNPKLPKDEKERNSIMEAYRLDRESIFDYGFRKEHYDLENKTGETYHAGKNIIDQIKEDLKENNSGRVELITHAPNVESSLMTLLNENKQDVTLKEVGGSFKPGESFEVIVNHDNDKIYSTILKYRGNETKINFNGDL